MEESRKPVSVRVSNKSAANSPEKPSAPAGPARSVLPVHDEPARGREPVLRDELDAVATTHRYPPEQLRKRKSTVPMGVFGSAIDPSLDQPTEREETVDHDHTESASQETKKRAVLDVSLDQSESEREIEDLLVVAKSNPKFLEQNDSITDDNTDKSVEQLESIETREPAKDLSSVADSHDSRPGIEDDDPLEVVAERIARFSVRPLELSSEGEEPSPELESGESVSESRCSSDATSDLGNAMKALFDNRKESEWDDFVRVEDEMYADDVSAQFSNKSAANSPEKPSAPTGPARMVLAVPDEPARGRWGDSNRIAPGIVPVLRDESAAVVTEQRHPLERLPDDERDASEPSPGDETVDVDDAESPLAPVPVHVDDAESPLAPVLVQVPDDETAIGEPLIVVEPADIESASSLAPLETKNAPPPGRPVVRGRVASAATAIVLLAATTWAVIESRTNPPTTLKRNGSASMVKSMVQAEVLPSVVPRIAKPDRQVNQRPMRMVEKKDLEQPNDRGKNPKSRRLSRRSKRATKSNHRDDPRAQREPVEVAESESAQSEPVDAIQDPILPPKPLPRTPSRDAIFATLTSLRSQVRQCVAQEVGVAELDINIKGSGRVSHVVVNGDFRGTKQGSCIARVVRKARFEPFEQPDFRVLFPYAF